MRFRPPHLGRTGLRPPPILCKGARSSWIQVVAEDQLTSTWKPYAGWLNAFSMMRGRQRRLRTPGV